MELAPVVLIEAEVALVVGGSPEESSAQMIFVGEASVLAIALVIEEELDSAWASET
jgi:hypothetical protein